MSWWSHIQLIFILPFIVLIPLLLTCRKFLSTICYQKSKSSCVLCLLDKMLLIFTKLAFLFCFRDGELCLSRSLVNSSDKIIRKAGSSIFQHSVEGWKINSSLVLEIRWVSLIRQNTFHIMFWIHWACQTYIECLIYSLTMNTLMKEWTSST